MKKQNIIAFSTILLLSVIVFGALLQPTSAASQVNVGDRFRIVSKRGQAATDASGTIEKLPAELRMTAQVTAVGERGFNFTILEGKIKIGDTTYSITKGAGGFHHKGNYTHVLIGGQAAAPDGGVLKFLLKGQTRSYENLLALRLEGGLKGTVSYRLRFLAEGKKI